MFSLYQTESYIHLLFKKTVFKYCVRSNTHYHTAKQKTNQPKRKNNHNFNQHKTNQQHDVC